MADFNIIDGPKKSPWLGVLYGPGGCGKSWLCSHAPEPFYIPVEPGVDLVNARKIDHIPENFDVLLDMMRFALKNLGDSKTVVVDSLGFVEALIYADVLAKNPMTSDGKDAKPATSISDYGFGRGYAKALDYWKRIIAACDAFNKRGANVILITHSHYKNLQTDGGDSYKYIDMALQSFGDYSVPELLKRRADWVYYMDSKVQTRTVRGQFGGTKTIASAGTEPEVAVHTRATSQFYAKVRTLDESAIPDYYLLDRATIVQDSTKIFNDLER